MRPLLLLAPLLTLSLGGCIASTLVDVATLPVRVGAKAVDLATTSQSEADQTRGRRLRQKEEALGRLSRERDRWARRCDGGRDADACARRERVEDEIAAAERQPT